LDPYYYVGEDATLLTRTYGFISTVSFSLIVVPWLCAITAVYSVIHLSIVLQVYKVKRFIVKFRNACLDAADGKADGIADFEEGEVGDADAASRAPKKNQQTMDYMPPFLTFYVIFTRMLVQMGLRKEEFVPPTPPSFQKIDADPNTPDGDVMWSQPLHEEIAAIFKDIQKTCKAFEFIISSLLAVALLLIVATCVSIYRGVLGDEEGADRWHYYFRDAFNWTFGTLAVVVCLGETAVLSRACKKAINEVASMPLIPLSVDANIRNDLNHTKQYVQSAVFVNGFGFILMNHKVTEEDMQSFFTLVYSASIFVIMSAADKAAQHKEVDAIKAMCINQHVCKCICPAAGGGVVSSSGTME